MKKGFIILLIVFGGLCNERAIAQKINLEKWVKHQRDSLIRNGIDTIIYYHHYCGECSLLENKDNKHREALDNGWTLIESYFIFKKNGDFFSLTFNYCSPPIISKLDFCKSIPYFLSIIPVLHKRDWVYAQMRKQAKFFPPIPTDGSYEEATIYFRKHSSKVSLSDYQKKEGYKYWKKYFWIDKELKIVSLIEEDLK
jgi:hypothetical protein